MLFCIGGSATNDGGAGLAAALGFELHDERGECIELPIGADLCRVARIVRGARVPAALARVKVRVACDVRNPLVGACGATRIYGPQKGVVTEQQFDELENGLTALGRCWVRDLGASAAIVELPGGGAAGGMGAGLVAFCRAELVSGVALIAAHVGLEAAVADAADLVLTGEGRLDASSGAGKVPQGVSELAHRLGVPCVAVCGAVEGGLQPQSETIAAAFSICSAPMTLQHAMAHAPELVAHTTANIMHTWLLARQSR